MYEIGQVWEHRWKAGNEPYSTEARGFKSRTGVITGIEALNGAPSKLFFSIPMIDGRKTGDVYVNEFDALADTKLIGVINVYEPVEEDEGGE
jgi:hypothetical protein